MSGQRIKRTRDAHGTFTVPRCGSADRSKCEPKSRSVIRSAQTAVRVFLMNETERGPESDPAKEHTYEKIIE